MPTDARTAEGLDLVTALGRLLQSGALRDAFAADPEAVARELGVQPSDRAALLRLVPAELEAQATVLLRKRFGLVVRALPRTCRALGDEAWQVFRNVARATWPDPKNPLADDARRFCNEVSRTRPAALCRVEHSRVQWLCDGSRWRVRWLTTVPFRTGFRPGVQILLRGRSKRWHEWVVYAGA